MLGGGIRDERGDGMRDKIWDGIWVEIWDGIRDGSVERNLAKMFKGKRFSKKNQLKAKLPKRQD